MLEQTTPFEGTYTEDVKEWIEHFEWNCRPAIRDSVISRKVTTTDKIIEQAKRKKQSLRMIERTEEKKSNQDMTENIKHMIADQIKA